MPKDVQATDAIGLLKEDHRTVEQLFERWTEVRPEEGPAVKASLVEQIVRELSIHAAIEEQIFYPAVREALPEGAGLVDHSLEEHQEAKDLLAEIEKLDPGDPALEDKVGTLVADVRAHVEAEEGEMFPKLAEALGPEKLEEIGKALEKAKKTAPTRPHPHAPNTPPANVVAAVPAAAVDRARDAVSGRSGRSRAVLIGLGVGLLVLLIVRRIARSQS
jgi:hemerythrin superfamily protein